MICLKNSYLLSFDSHEYIYTHIMFLFVVVFSLGYLAEHMDPLNMLEPLFEAQLELREPDLVFVPPLDSSKSDSFLSLVQGLIEDIIQMATLIPRVSEHANSQDYMVGVCL